jgi:hypothetical protein
MIRARLLVVGLALMAGCESKGLAQVGDALLAQAFDVIEPDKGPTLVIGAEDPTALPDGKVVRLAFDSKVPWSRVKQLVEWVEAEGKKPVLLVGYRHKVKGFVLNERLEGEPIELLTYVGGKACVKPRESIEAACVETAGGVHIEESYVREFVRAAKKAYGLSDVEVELPDELEWADVVRAIDGARTCCGKPTMRVAIKGLSPS